MVLQNLAPPGADLAPEVEPPAKRAYTGGLIISTRKPNLDGLTYERSEYEWYVEEPWAIDALFERVRFAGTVHDPCCGQGTIPKSAHRYGIGATGADIVDRGFGQGGINFLRDDRPWQNIVMNPPFDGRRLAEDFIHHALAVAEFKVAAFVRLNFLAGAGRRKRLFDVRRPARVLIFSRRVNCPPGGQGIDPKGGKTDYCWLVWSQDHDGPTIMEWIVA